MREIGKDGRVWRLTKDSWNFLRNFDSDPNEALKKIQAQMNAKPIPVQQAQPAAHGCNFNEKTLKETIKNTMEEVLRPFMGS